MKPTLGEYLRERRTQRGIGLREMAKRIRYTPSYLSKVERGEEEPGEALIILLAKHLGESSDTLLLMAGRVPPDIRLIIQSKPEVLEIIRRVA